MCSPALAAALQKIGLRSRGAVRVFERDSAFDSRKQVTCEHVALRVKEQNAQQTTRGACTDSAFAGQGYGFTLQQGGSSMRWLGCVVQDTVVRSYSALIWTLALS